LKNGILGFPKFKKRSNNQLCSFPQGTKIDFENGLIHLPKSKNVKVIYSQRFKGTAKTVTVSKNCAGQYFVSILVDTNVNQLAKTGKTVGIDLGLKEFAVTSDNTHIANPRYFRESQAKIARLQMWQAKKVGAKKGEKKSSRWLKLQGRINRQYEHLTNPRKNFLHVITTDLIRNYDVLCLEDLNVKGMMQNHKLAKSIGDVSWSMFNVFLNYKAEWYGKEIRRVDRFYVSSKTCSSCGHKLDDLTLNDRVFACPICGLEIDRDLNAAINIKQCSMGNTAQRTLMDEVTSPDEAPLLYIHD
jgi:putative transposase